MTAERISRGEARQRILAAAETLFAEHGVEAVSLRRINAAAGVSPGVLHYHFGSREILVAELINRHMSHLVEARELAIEPLLAQQRPDLHAVVASLVEPLARLALGGGAEGARYVRFMSRLYADRSPVLEEVSQRYQQVNSAYPTLLSRALPGRSRSELALRLAMANHAMLQTLADYTAPSRHWLDQAGETLDEDELIAMLVDFISCGIAGSGA